RDGRTRLDIRLTSNELEVCHRRRGNRPRECETVEIVTDTGEEALTVAKKRGHEADLHLVDEAGGEILLRGARAAGQRHVLPPRRAPRLLERRLDPVGVEGERRAALQPERLARMMSKHEHRVMVRGIVSPPTRPRGAAFPRAGVTAEHVPAHDRRTDVRERFLDNLIAFVDLATGLSVHRTPGA